MDRATSIPENQFAEISALLPSRLSFGPPSFDFSAIPAGPGVFLLETGGEPFLGKSATLRRRLQRLLEEPEPGQDTRSRRRLNLRATTRAIHFRATGSSFENSLLLYRVARAAFPGRYRKMLRLRTPALLKLNLDNPYPRCYVTRRLGRAPSLYYGPFPSRAAAETLAAAFLDLFLVRRCVEAIRPDPAHPGCVYGEMNMCLRPCQAVATPEQYAEEAARLAAFLSSGGASLLKTLEAERDRASGEMQFEEAARLHRRVEKVQQALRQRPEMATDLERLHGLVIQPAAQRQAVELFPVWRGSLLPQITFTFEVVEGKPVSLDARLREVLAGLRFQGGRGRVRAEHLALLARWFYRGTRVGEFIPFDSYERVPYRKIVGAISRVARSAPPEQE